ncbi:MAG: helicase C-terminal domain-containing protein [Solirubrobacterales bacterium]
MTFEQPDFRELLSGQASERFQTLRPAQDAVLAEYATSHLETLDLAIELPTGAGKSLVALLIGEAWRREGRTVAVLTGNKALAAQMEREGTDLHVPVARMEGRGEDIGLSLRRRYRRSQAIGVMNYWVMFNSNPVVDSADLLIVDDAHLAEGALEGLFSMQIDRYAHPQLFATLVTELAARLPDYASLEDARSEDPRARAGVELMSYLDQELVAARIREVIDGAPELDTDIDLRFRWRGVRDRLPESNLYLSQRTITIRPFCLPVQTLERWSDPSQRLYLSATIGDPADLQRRLGSARITKIGSDADAPTLGRRLIVMNNDIEAAENELLPARVAQVVLQALKVQPKALWLCASRAQADTWRQTIPSWLQTHGLADAPTWALGTLGDEMERFRTAPAGHLFVAGRFDGMDFAGDECRLVVLATLPRAVNDQEQFVSDYLRDASFLIGRTNQRITQALGRCNRHAEDHALYVLADRRLATHLSQEANRRGLPPALQAELDLAEELDGIADGALADTVRLFLAGDFNAYDEQLTQLQREMPEPPALTPDDADHEVTGWLAMTGRQDYLAAETSFAARQQELSQQNLRELGAFVQYTEAKAAHLEALRGDLGARARSGEAITHAIGRGGASSSWFNRLRSSVARHEATAQQPTPSGEDFAAACTRSFDEQLENSPPGHKLDRWTARLSEWLSSDSHDVYAKGLGALGELLGYSASFPNYGAATDCRWRGVFGNAREVFTFECKIENQPGNEIDAHCVGQAHNQYSRALAEYGDTGYAVRGLILTHLERLAADAAPGLGEIVVLRRDALEALHQRTNELLAQFAAEWSLEDPHARVAAADNLASRLPRTGWLREAIDNTDRFLDAASVLAVWP